jgi:WD40 repeat protein
MTTTDDCAPISTTPGVLNRCGHTFGVAYSPDGQLLAAGMDWANPSVRLWRLGDDMPLPAFEGQGNEVTYNLAFSPDGNTLAAAGFRVDNSGLQVPLLRLWDVATGSLVRSLPVNTGGYADTVAFSHDGVLLATAGAYGATEIWRVSDGGRVRNITIAGSAHNIHFSPDDSQIIVATTDGKARVWNVATGALVLDKVTVAVEMADADFSPDGKQIASTGDGNVVRFWNAATGDLLQTLSGHANYISHVVWIDQNRVVSGDWQGGVILWTRDDLGSFTASRTWSTGGQTSGIAISPDKATLVTGGMDPTTYATGFVFISL